jgi:Porin PorA
MRQVIGLAVSGLAIACAAIAVVVAGHITGPAARSAVRERQTIVLTGERAAYLSPTRLTEVTGASMQVTDTLTGAAEAGFPQISVWSEVSSPYDTTHRQPLEPMSRTFAFDAATAELVNCCDQNINGNAVIPQRGIAGWVFPRTTRKQTYDVFDTTLDAPEPFSYSGTATVGGIRAYRFEENITAAPAGFSLLSKAEPELYSMHRTYWVDPETGALLKITEDEDLYLVRPRTGSTVTHLFAADLSTTPATVASLVRQDRRGRGAGATAGRGPRLFLGLAAGLAAAAGILSVFGPGGRPAPRPARRAGPVRRGTAAWSRPPLPEADR